MKGRSRSIGFDLLWLFVCAAASSLYCATTTTHLSATFDEPLYMKLGLEHWRTGSTFGLMRAGTMPLPVDVTTLPVYVWERCRDIPFDPTADLDRILPVARLGNLPFWWLLLGYGWLAARRIAGRRAGRFAVAVIACEPNLLAHAGLATTDIAITATLLMVCIHFRAGRDRSWGWRVGLPALCLGAALLAKVSALAFAPICMIVIEVQRRWELSETAQAWPRFKDALRIWSRRNVLDAVAMGTIALVIAYVYCGCDWRTEPKILAYAQTLPDGPTRYLVTWLGEHLCIFDNAGFAIWRQVKHNSNGHGSYLLGQATDRSFWYYFPVALSIKCTTALLLLPAVIAVIRRRNLGNWAFLSALALLVFSLNCRVQIGVRLQLPLIALAIIGSTSALVRTAAEMPRSGRRALTALACITVVWIAAGSASVWPDGLRYANEAWGGPESSYRLVSDSNYDWGQGLKDLTEWNRRHNAGTLDVWYFGTDPACNSPPLHSIPIHSLPIRSERELQEHVRGRYLAVATTLLYGGYCNEPNQRELVEELRRKKPVDRTGTFLIFDLKPKAETAQR